MTRSSSACSFPGLCAAASLLSLALTSQAQATQSETAEQPATLPSAQFGGTFSAIESAGNSNKSGQAEFRITAPVTSIFGASLDGTLSKTNIQIDKPVDLDGSTLCSYVTLGATGTLFARRPSLGRISAKLSTAQLKSKCGSSSGFVGNDDTLRSTGYSLAAEYYLSALTLGAERIVTSFGKDTRRVADILSATWYPITDLSVSSNAGRVDGKMQYGLSLEHLPEMLGGTASVSLSFSNLDTGNGSVRTIGISFAYLLGGRVDLKTRDRQYR